MTLIMRPIITLAFFCLIFVISSAHKCPLGCVQCHQNHPTCTACLPTYYLTTLGQCIQVSGNDRNCSVFSGGDHKCHICKPTYRMFLGNCVKDYTGCLEYSIRQGCLNCGFGTRKDGKECKGVLHCSEYNQQGQCQACERGYLLYGGVCYFIGSNCGSVDVSSGACRVCRPGFEMVGYQCIPQSSESQNCEIWNEGGECLFCRRGFSAFNGSCKLIPICTRNQYLSLNVECLQMPYACRQINVQQDICEKCYPNHEVVNQTCTLVLPDNCNDVDRRGHCSDCQDRFYAFNYTCKEVSLYCGTYDKDGQCLTCNIQEYDLWNGLCRDPNCLQPSTTTCLRCKENYIFNIENNRCMLVDDNCLDLTITQCFRCRTSFYLTSTICEQLPQNCLRASITGACLKCRHNHYLQFNRCFPVNRTIGHCRTYSSISSQPTCTICELGYFLALGQCIQVVPFCSLILSDGKCVLCRKGYRLSNDRCESVTQTLDDQCYEQLQGTCLRCLGSASLGVNGRCYPRSDLNCLNSNQQTGCSSCAEGKVVSRGICLQVNYVDRNCRNYEGSNCTSCYDGYYLIKNRCSLPNSGCASYSRRNGGCLSCYPGYTLTNYQCVVITKIQNCLSYDEFGKCLRCSRMFYLTNNTCYIVEKECLRYNAFTGDCTACYWGWKLEDGNCSKPSRSNTALKDVCKVFIGDGVCGQCYPGFVLNSGQCQTISRLCRSVDQGGRCQGCYPGYELKNGDCVVAGMEYTLIPCLASRNDGTCVRCIPAYVLSDSEQCIIDSNLLLVEHNIPFCRIASNQTHCSLCQVGFYTRQGFCYQVSPNCRVYNPENGNCITCKTNYVLSHGTCLFPALGIDPFCQQYEGVFCGWCKDGFYLKNYLCTPIDPNCTKFNHSIQQCTQCSKGKPLFDVCQ